MTPYPLLALFAQKYLLMVLSSKRWRAHKFRDDENKSVMMLSVWHPHTSSSHRAEQAGMSSPVPAPLVACAWGYLSIASFCVSLRTRSLKCVVQLFSMAFALNKTLLHGYASPRDPDLLPAPQKENFQSFHGSPCYVLIIFITIAAEQRRNLKNIQVICI